VTYPLQGVGPDNFEKIGRPRVFKSHYPVQLLPEDIWKKNARVVFISRDVKDVAVSGYFFRKTVLHERVESIEEHFEDFLNDRVWFGPYREHLSNYQKLEGKSNVLLLTYEGVVKDWEGSIRKAAKFLGKEASDENVKKLVEYLDFKAMKSKFHIWLFNIILIFFGFL
jgi:Sulfotransferase domain